MKVKIESESEIAQLCPTLSDPMDCSLPGSSIHGILQARVLEWGAIAFSNLIATKVQSQQIQNLTFPPRVLCSMFITLFTYVKENENF